MVVLVVTAGCLTVAGDRGTDTTVTPAPVPTAAGGYPPGVTATGVSGPTLAAAHERVLDGTNYTLVTRWRIVGPDGTIRRANRTWQVRAGGDTFAGRYEVVSREARARSNGTADSSPGRGWSAIDATSYWTDGDGFAIRQRDGERLVYLGWADTGRPAADLAGSRSINRIVGRLRFTVTRTDEGVVLRIAGLRDRESLSTPGSVDDEHDVSGTIRVRTDGVVTRRRLVYNASLDGRPVRVIRETRVSDVGSTTVRRPDWIDEARNRTDPGETIQSLYRPGGLPGSTWYSTISGARSGAR